MLRSVDLSVDMVNLNRSGPQRASRRWRKRMTVDQPDRRALECSGWRTMLDYTENHVRAVDGTLLAVVPRWTAEAERAGVRRTTVASATAGTRDEAWARLRRATAQADRARSDRAPSNCAPYDCAGDF